MNEAEKRELEQIYAKVGRVVVTSAVLVVAGFLIVCLLIGVMSVIFGIEGTEPALRSFLERGLF